MDTTSTSLPVTIGPEPFVRTFSFVRALYPSPPKMQIKHDGGLPRSDRLLSSKPHQRALGWDQTNLLKLKPASVFNAEDETRFQPQP